MSRVSLWHRQFSALVLLSATSCVRFGYEVLETSAGNDDASSTSSPSAAGSRGTGKQIGGSAGVGASSASLGMQQGGANQGSGGTPVSSTGSVNPMGTSGSTTPSQGGANSGGNSGALTASTGSSNQLGTAGSLPTAKGGANSGGNQGTAGAAVRGGSSAIQQGGAGSGGNGGVTTHARGGGGGGGAGAGSTLSSGANGGAGAGSTLSSGANGGAGVGGAGGSAGTAGSDGPVGLSCAAALGCRQDNCCTSIRVIGGTYNRGTSPAYAATINDFYLDKYEVTVGRFRAFVASYDAWRSALHPSANEGLHENPIIAGSGWDSAWNSNLPTSAAVFADVQHLAYCGARSTWTSSAGTASENYPINCVTWYEAFAFCIWDGGRLATEAEWQYVAGGGSENRTYPWGATPNTDPLPANYFDNHNTAFLEVGSEPGGNGRWGHSDLAGSMTEWILDWYSLDYPTSCNNCASLTASANRASRGGTWLTTAMSLEVGARGFTSPDARLSFAGVRCARTAK